MFGKLGKLGRVNPTYAYARARDWHVVGVSGNQKNLRLIAITFPSFPTFPKMKKTVLKTVGYVVRVVGCLLPIKSGLLPYLPTAVQHLAESSK
jgi:hypothetical protein